MSRIFNGNQRSCYILACFVKLTVTHHLPEAVKWVFSAVELETLVLWQLELVLKCIIYWSLNWLMCNFLFSPLSFSSHQLNSSQGLYSSSVHVTHGCDMGDQINVEYQLHNTVGAILFVWWLRIAFTLKTVIHSTILTLINLALFNWMIYKWPGTLFIVDYR
jgi:hypothetical protein